MDNFVAKLRNNINVDVKTGRKLNSSRFRELLYHISSSDPDIDKISDCDEDGDMHFEVPMKSLGITYDILVKYKKDICSDFMANFLGELLIRENINVFANILTSIDPQNYQSIVNRFEHRKFGMDVSKDRLVFCFHVSLLQEIMLEDVKRNVR